MHKHTQLQLTQKCSWKTKSATIEKFIRKSQRRTAIENVSKKDWIDIFVYFLSDARKGEEYFSGALTKVQEFRSNDGQKIQGLYQNFTNSRVKEDLPKVLRKYHQHQRKSTSLDAHEKYILFDPIQKEHFRAACKESVLWLKDNVKNYIKTSAPDFIHHN